MLFLALALIIAVAFGQIEECRLTKEDRRYINRLTSQLRLHFMNAAVTGDTEDVEAFIRENFVADFITDSPIDPEDVLVGRDAYIDTVFTGLLRNGAYEAFIINAGANQVYDCGIYDDTKIAQVIEPVHIVFENEGFATGHIDDLVEIAFVEVSPGQWKVITQFSIQISRDIEEVVGTTTTTVAPSGGGVIVVIPIGLPIIPGFASRNLSHRLNGLVPGLGGICIIPGEGQVEAY